MFVLDPSPGLQALNLLIRRFDRRAYHAIPKAPVAVFALVAATTATLIGCGASYQAIYEGEIRFEHCYRLDDEPGIPLTQRRECWREWTKFYTYGQTRDRLEYALRRQRELTSQIGSSSGFRAAPTPVGTPPTEPVAAPPPTSPFVPPPHVHDGRHYRDKPKVDEATSGELMDLLSSGSKPRSQPCLIVCLRDWHTCTERCNTKDQAECRKACDAAFNGCGARCLQQ